LDQVREDAVAADSSLADESDVTQGEPNHLEPAAKSTAVYMPVRRIVSDKERLKCEEMRQSVEEMLTPLVQIKTVPATIYSVPIHLVAFACDLGDIASFPAPTKDESNKLGCMSFAVVGCWAVTKAKVPLGSSRLVLTHTTKC